MAECKQCKRDVGNYDTSCWWCGILYPAGTTLAKQENEHKGPDLLAGSLFGLLFFEDGED